MWHLILPTLSHPFDTHPWYSAWWEAFGAEAGVAMAVCAVRRDGRLAAAYPLLERDGRLGPFVNGHSAMTRPLASDEEAMRTLAGAVLEREPRRLDLACLPLGDPGLEAFAAAAGAVRRRVGTEPTYVSPLVATDGDFDAWRDESKPRWGAPLERFRRKMGRDFEAEFAIAQAPVALDAELDDGFRVEASGWKGESGTAITSAAETERFYRRVAAEFAAVDGLRFNRIRLDGATVAWDLCLQHRERLYLLKTGFDEDFRKLAPGLVMRLAVIEHCFEGDLVAHELLGEESEWKAKFANAPGRAHGTLRLYPAGVRGLLEQRYRSSLRPRLGRAYKALRQD